MNPEHGGLIYTRDGRPFSTENAAKSHITREGLEHDLHMVLPVPGGYAVKKMADEDAVSVEGKHESPTPEFNRVMALKNHSAKYLEYFREACRACGFTPARLVRDSAAELAKAEKFVPTNAQAAQMLPILEYVIKMNERAHKVLRVRFSAKSSPNDPDEVQLICQGERLIVQREQDVCIPFKFLESADHATFDVFTQKPGERFKMVGKVKCYPYSVIGEATMDEFIAQRAAGTDATKKSTEAPEKG